MFTLGKMANLGYNAFYRINNLFYICDDQNSMTKADIFKLTLALYKVTALFPKKEPLKFALRRRALKIFSSLSISEQSLSFLSQTEKTDIVKRNLFYLDEITLMFDLAKEQDWVDSKNFLILENEYEKIKEILSRRIKEKTAVKQISEPREIKEKEPAKRAVKKAKGEERDEEIKVNFFEDPEKMTASEKKILKFLKEKGKAKRSDIEEGLPDYGTRSLQRKLNNLRNRQMLKAVKKGRDIYYFHKS